MCASCLDGDHDDPAKTAVSRDAVACAETVRAHKELVGLEEVYVTRVSDDGDGTGTLPAVAATVADDRVRLADIQLVMEDDDGTLLVYAEAADVLGVLTRNVRQIDGHTSDDVDVQLSDAALRLTDAD